MKCTGIGLLCGLILLLASGLEPGRANNLQITNVSLVNVSGGELDIQFDMTWENSWRSTWSDNGGTVTVTNWDAVWIYAKIRQSGGLWRHVMLTATGHTATGGTVIEPSVNNGTNLGAMVYRTAIGSGAMSCPAMRLHWNYAAAGLPGTNDLDIAVFGTEMVYIPEGAFALGSGGNENNHFYRYPDMASTYLVTGETALAVGPVAGRLDYIGGGDHAGPVPAEFPKGYQAFYAMKYEVSQGQYADFLNLIDPGIVSRYFPNTYNINRNTIRQTNGMFVAEAPDRGCNHLNGDRILSWLDWSGLRPMTELEFEKMSRGVRTPWINEYIWGNTTYVEQSGHAGVDGSGTETALPANANIHLGTFGGTGPVRCGLFATGASTREQAGAGYYGNMDLGGNLFEMTVSISQNEGRVFKDVYGDGNEYTEWSGHWPGVGLYAYSNRGGALGSSALSGRARISDRTNTDVYALYSGVSHIYGIRGVRTLP